MPTLEHQPSQQLREQELVRQICSASNALDAHRLFQRSATVLKDWQIIFAEESDAGSIKLLNQQLGSSGLATSIFRGKSLWLMDADFVSNTEDLKFRCGSAMFVDSNAASYIRAIAYESKPSEAALNGANLINKIGHRLQHLNPYFYLWESMRSWNQETVARCKETLAAIHALSSSGSKLTVEWGGRYRAIFKDRAENFAAGLLVEFERDMKAGLSDALNERLALIEIVLLRTQIIELSSKKSKEKKLAQLVSYMHEELATMMLRELIVCGDILSHSKQSRISKKLNSIQNNANPLALIRNCAWDMYIPRALDALTAITPDQPLSVDFYFPEILSFDGDVTDIINTTKLRAIAIHGPTKKNIPFFDSDIAEWLGNRVGSKRMDALSEYFLIDAFLDRAKRRSSKSAQEILLGNQVELMSLIQKLSSQRHEQR